MALRPVEMFSPDLALGLAPTGKRKNGKKRVSLMLMGLKQLADKKRTGIVGRSQLRNLAVQDKGSDPLMGNERTRDYQQVVRRRANNSPKGHETKKT